MAGSARRYQARVVVAQAGQRAGSRTEEGRHHRCGRRPRPKVRSGGKPDSEALETEDVTPRHRRGRPLTSQAIGMLLLNQMYAGIVDVPEYGVRAKRGDFESLRGLVLS